MNIDIEATPDLDGVPCLGARPAEIAWIPHQEDSHVDFLYNDSELLGRLGSDSELLELSLDDEDPDPLLGGSPVLLGGSTLLLDGGDELLGKLEDVAELLGSDALTLEDERLSLDEEGADELDGELLLDWLEELLEELLELLEELLEDEQHSQQQQPA